MSGAVSIGRFGRAVGLFVLAGGCVFASPCRAEEPWVRPAHFAELSAAFRRPAVIDFPAANAFSGERELLGRTLFFDPRLSGSGVLACATCHNPSFGWGDGLRLGRGEGLQLLDRRTPTILNAAWGGSFFWDGRAPTLEIQAAGPMGSAREMNQDLAVLPAKLRRIAGYGPLFERAYPGEDVSLSTITKAIATFERTVAAAQSPFDLWLGGNEGAVPTAAKRGFMLFTGKANCAACHTGWSFTDGKFHDIGLASADVGRAGVAPAEPLATQAFKTPTLRDIAKRAPYMHDGSKADLQAVMVHYAFTFEARPGLSPLIRRPDLDGRDIGDVLAFLESLSAPSRSFASPTLPQ